MANPPHNSFEYLSMLDVHRNLSTENDLGGQRQFAKDSNPLLDSPIDVGLETFFGVTDQSTNLLERRPVLLAPVPFHPPFAQLR